MEAFSLSSHASDPRPDSASPSDLCQGSSASWLAVLCTVVMVIGYGSDAPDRFHFRRRLSFGDSLWPSLSGQNRCVIVRGTFAASAGLTASRLPLFSTRRTNQALTTGALPATMAMTCSARARRTTIIRHGDQKDEQVADYINDGCRDQDHVLVHAARAVGLMVRHTLQGDGEDQADGVEEVEPDDGLDDPPEQAAGDALGVEEADVEEQDGQLGEEHGRPRDHLEVLEDLEV
ncbi:hypothetical protein VM1G_11275 [Cytospora mali]|uniref:Uncharacterized protein n=1 Tax=Cytospora mali TaxID=578113 RepID=A0A194VKP2_CYTMA|nr:hypothetical protein VM1G_11275 [Valsa mali]